MLGPGGDHAIRKPISFAAVETKSLVGLLDKFAGVPVSWTALEREVVVTVVTSCSCSGMQLCVGIRSPATVKTRSGQACAANLLYAHTLSEHFYHRKLQCR
jgi:hypothetical protein